ncbi:Pentatricopeptide repeat-containing protein [Apostasia shenzhenica]|uniref:Pentatricopeptide repeat-containing protein n=1 Tax=Apostasia shenzhenica TaxID=1088818 RepID=A0A2I0A5G7_9ASPA|nr:Pentatricopeptide repeat-containing protein [Apostasia shenzhenica]
MKSRRMNSKMMRKLWSTSSSLQSRHRSFQPLSIPSRLFSRYNMEIGRLSRSGDITAARRLFDRMPSRDVVSWNVMITAHWQNNDLPESKKLFRSMPERNVVSWNTMIAGCLNDGLIDEAFKCYFLEMPERNVASWNAMISGFVKSDRVSEAEKLFVEMPNRNVISYTAMVDGFARNGKIDRARELFDGMPQRNLVSWAAMISGYVENGRFEEAKFLFDRMPEKNAIATTAMITGNYKEGKIDAARSLFDGMSFKDTVSWNTMIAGYLHNGYSEEALKLQTEMMKEGIKPDHATFVTALTACSTITALHRGRQCHAACIKFSLEFDILLCNALMNMYSRCGSIDDAESIFETMRSRDLISWNTIIAAFAHHGLYHKVSNLLHKMECNGFIPNGVSFLSLLSACRHSGKVDESLNWFNLMVSKYRITPRTEHYACLVDILSRAGILEKACKHIKEMTFDAEEESSYIWAALLGACQMKKNLRVGELAAEKLLQLDPKSSGTYIMLSNLYAEAGLWEEVTKVRDKMKDNRVKKEPGYSWTEISGKVHFFLVGDSSHKETVRIRSALSSIYLHMRKSPSKEISSF